MSLQYRNINNRQCWVLTTPRMAAIISRSEAERIFRQLNEQSQQRSNHVSAI